MELIERVNIAKLDQVLNLNIDSSEKTKLKKYRNELGDSDIIKIKYEQSYEGIGRYYSSYSLQNMDCNIRNYIVNDYCVDGDIENCHPVILNYLMNKYNIVSNELNEYIKDRSGVLIREKQDKEYITTVINFSSFTSNNEFFNKINKTIYSSLVPILKERPEYKETYTIAKVKDKKNKKNIDGSFISLVLQTFEVSIITEIMNILKEKNISTCSYIFDGLLMYNNENINNELFEIINNRVLNTIGININFRLKPMNSNILDDIKNDENDYHTWKEKWEVENCKMIYSEKNLFFNIKNVFEEDYNRLFMKYDSGFGLFKTYEHNVKNVPPKFLSRWMHDPNIRVHYRPEFVPYPLHCPKTVYNLWTGFDILKCEPKYDFIYKEVNGIKIYNRAVDLYKRLNLHLCSGNEDHAIFMERHDADMVQNPGRKNGIAYVLNGDSGTGKGTKCHFYKGILGKYYCQIADADKVFGRFNDVIEDKILICFDESISSKMIESNGKLKNLITEPTITIESKGLKIREGVPSCCRGLISTNETNPVALKQKERRIVVHKPLTLPKDLNSELYVNNKLTLDNGDFRNVYDYLMTIDNTGINWQQDRPITDAYMDIAQTFYRSECIWLFYFSKKYDRIMISNKEIIQGYDHFMDMNKSKFKMGSIEISKFILSLIKLDKNLIIAGFDKKANRAKQFNHVLIEEYLRIEKLFIHSENSLNEDIF